MQLFCILQLFCNEREHLEIGDTSPRGYIRGIFIIHPSSIYSPSTPRILPNYSHLALQRVQYTRPQAADIQRRAAGETELLVEAEMCEQLPEDLSRLNFDRVDFVHCLDLGMWEREKS